MKYSTEVEIISLQNKNILFYFELVIYNIQKYL